MGHPSEGRVGPASFPPRRRQMIERGTVERKRPSRGCPVANLESSYRFPGRPKVGPKRSPREERADVADLRSAANNTWSGRGRSPQLRTMSGLESATGSVRSTSGDPAKARPRCVALCTRPTLGRSPLLEQRDASTVACLYYRLPVVAFGIFRVRSARVERRGQPADRLAGTRSQGHAVRSTFTKPRVEVGGTSAAH